MVFDELSCPELARGEGLVVSAASDPESVQVLAFLLALEMVGVVRRGE